MRATTFLSLGRKPRDTLRSLTLTEVGTSDTSRGSGAVSCGSADWVRLAMIRIKRAGGPEVYHRAMPRTNARWPLALRQVLGPHDRGTQVGHHLPGVEHLVVGRGALAHGDLGGGFVAVDLLDI